jgi:hypothetical protein
MKNLDMLSILGIFRQDNHLKLNELRFFAGHRIC